MKRFKNILFLIFLFASQNLLISKPYWNSNQTNSWYQTMYTILFGTTLEDAIPELLIQRDCTLRKNNQLCKLPNRCEHILIKNCSYSIDTISKPITSGYTYDAFNVICKKENLLLQYPIDLRYAINNLVIHPTAIASYIILPISYTTLPDAIKLFILYHELEHHLHNDIGNNHLEQIITLAQNNPVLKNQLEEHKEKLHQHIIRFVEYRADSKAVESFQCPYCLQEIVTLHKQVMKQYPCGTFDPQGYLQPWQIEEHIEKLLCQKTCCKHHLQNHQTIDLSIIDESSLLNRLMIENLNT
ncbi:MAG: hypothetical protein ACXWL2_04365 [Candidatus Chromulinivorax sp.]